MSEMKWLVTLRHLGGIKCDLLIGLKTENKKYFFSYCLLMNLLYIVLSATVARLKIIKNKKAKKRNTEYSLLYINEFTVYCPECNSS